ncbi:type IV toxin-antitoxin system AbiEi family antitoxin domain-containing protein [Microbacterium sp. LjRoot45]|uniref:DUF559 domain-containing protein n=1 Tax=Microbacterium sp. LjRoot45 TaxID=3342329 RepID=UPI003ED011E3
MSNATRDALLRWIDVRGGVVRTTAAQDAGHSRHRIADAERAGDLVRVRRGWVALPSADSFLIAAARAGVVLTCVTQAARRGLWVHGHGDATRPHVAAPSHAGRVCARDATVHWSAPVVPRHPDRLEDGIENTLVAVARCQPWEEALAVWESALRQGQTTREEMARLPLPSQAQRLCREARLFADSGLETIVPARLRWLKLPLLPQAWLLGRPVDLLIGDRLVLQIDGGHHVGAQRSSDIEHDARLLLHGYHVIRVTYAQVMDDWLTVQQLIAGAVAQGLHLAR